VQKNIVIIGGGAAGFFCAVNCARLNPMSKITILERSSKLLNKVRVSGGGRCNVTHQCFDNSELVKNYPRGEKELKSAFNRFSVNDTIQWFSERGVKLKTEEDGRMFPVSNSSETIIQCLLEDAARHHVEIMKNCEVISIRKNISKDNFELTLVNGSTILCDKLVIATGGRPKESGYNWLREPGHGIQNPVPSLFTFNIPDKKLTVLMGLSVPKARVKIAGTPLKMEGPLLITHWGISGPAILKLSAWGAQILHDLNYHFAIRVTWVSYPNEEKLKSEFQRIRTEDPAKTIVKSNPFDLPKRLWEYLLQRSDITEGLRWAELPKKNLHLLINTLLNDEYKVSGKTTFKEEFVTCGGINLDEVNFKTMQSNKANGLYFIGEVLNIDGVTGGFNFQNAWTTGWIAAVDISNNSI
jgi:predicted Rossmann fold flavoprotein